MASLLGHLRFCSCVTSCARPLIRTVYIAMGRRVNTSGWDGFVRLSLAVKDRLYSIERILRVAIHDPGLAPRVRRVIGYSDASEPQGGYVIAGASGGFRGFLWNQSSLSLAMRAKKVSMPYLEALALKACVDAVLFDPDLRAIASGGYLSVGIDSSSVLWAVLRGSSRESHLNDVLTHIFSSTQQIDCRLELFHVASACNPSDPISRIPPSQVQRVHLHGRWLLKKDHWPDGQQTSLPL